MFKMVNRHTGAVDFVNKPEDKERLENLGFHEVKEEPKATEQNKTAVKRAATKKNTTPKGEKK